MPRNHDQAVLLADARLDSAVLSVRDKGRPKRVALAALALLKACECSEAAATANHATRKMARRKRAIEERAVDVLEAAEERKQQEYDAKHPKPRAWTIEY